MLRLKTVHVPLSHRVLLQMVRLKGPTSGPTTCDSLFMNWRSDQSCQRREQRERAKYGRRFKCSVRTAALMLGEDVQRSSPRNREQIRTRRLKQGKRRDIVFRDTDGMHGTRRTDKIRTYLQTGLLLGRSSPEKSRERLQLRRGRPRKQWSLRGRKQRKVSSGKRLRVREEEANDL